MAGAASPQLEEDDQEGCHAASPASVRSGDRDGAVAEWLALRVVEHFPLPSPPPLFLDRDGAHR